MREIRYVDVRQIRYADVREIRLGVNAAWMWAATATVGPVNCHDFESGEAHVAPNPPEESRVSRLCPACSVRLWCPRCLVFRDLR